MGHLHLNFICKRNAEAADHRTPNKGNTINAFATLLPLDLPLFERIQSLKVLSFQ